MLQTARMQPVRKVEAIVSCYYMADVIMNQKLLIAQGLYTQTWKWDRDELGKRRGNDVNIFTIHCVLMWNCQKLNKNNKNQEKKAYYSFMDGWTHRKFSLR